jgi:hypothetical protein
VTIGCKQRHRTYGSNVTSGKKLNPWRRYFDKGPFLYHNRQAGWEHLGKTRVVWIVETGPPAGFCSLERSLKMWKVLSSILAPQLLPKGVLGWDVSFLSEEDIPALLVIFILNSVWFRCFGNHSHRN